MNPYRFILRDEGVYEVFLRDAEWAQMGGAELLGTVEYYFGRWQAKPYGWEPRRYIDDGTGRAARFPTRQEAAEALDARSED